MMSSNIFLLSVHSVGESLSQVPGQMCGPSELVNPPHAATLVAVFCYYVTEHVLPLRMATRDVYGVHKT